MRQPGNYYVIEGLDGTDKATQAEMAVDRRTAEGYDAIKVHEPGGTDMGLAIEKLTKDRTIGRTALTDLMLFTADRIEVYEKVIQPALASGIDVFADRNWLSSVAYQGVAGGVGASRVAEVTRDFLPEEYVSPRFTFLMYTTDAHRSKMLSTRDTSSEDYYESQADKFQQGLVAGYDQGGLLVPGTKKINGVNRQSKKHISAVGTVEEVHERIWSTLQDQKLV